MNEWWLVGLLLAVMLVASTFIVYPLRGTKWLCATLLPVLLIIMIGCYSFWGSFPQWQEHIHHNQAQQRAQNMLQSIKSPKELIAKLRAKVDDNPNSAKGWYLLGRLYSSQNEHQNAVDAFAKACQFEPENEQYTMNYAHSLWVLNNQQFNAQILDIFRSLLAKNPDQPDALAMLAMSAFVSHAYEDAIDYWRRLLKMAPEQSDEALAIRKAIAKAQERINLGRINNDQQSISTH